MDDTISRQEAIDVFPEDNLPWDTFEGYIAPHLVRKILEQLPSAQPQRMRGEWIDVTKIGGAELWKCSKCGKLELEDSYFCPNCGADMRGEQDEE